MKLKASKEKLAADEKENSDKAAKTNGSLKKKKKEEKLTNGNHNENNKNAIIRKEETNEHSLPMTKIDIGVELEYTKLRESIEFNPKETICSECSMRKALIECKGSCQRNFHIECIGKLIANAGTGKNSQETVIKCDDCLNNRNPCFLCKKSSTNEQPTKQCSANGCAKYYHEACAKGNELFRTEGKSSCVCPLHTCHTCWLSKVGTNNGGSNRSSNIYMANLTATKGRLFKVIFTTQN
jgi:hypothetical protein